MRKMWMELKNLHVCYPSSTPHGDTTVWVSVLVRGRKVLFWKGSWSICGHLRLFSSYVAREREREREKGEQGNNSTAQNRTAQDGVISAATAEERLLSSKDGSVLRRTEAWGKGWNYKVRSELNSRRHLLPHLAAHFKPQLMRPPLNNQISPLSSLSLSLSFSFPF